MTKLSPRAMLMTWAGCLAFTLAVLLAGSGNGNGPDFVGCVFIPDFDFVFSIKP